MVKEGKKRINFDVAEIVYKEFRDKFPHFGEVSIFLQLCMEEAALFDHIHKESKTIRELTQTTHERAKMT